MSDTLTLKIITPKEVFFEGAVETVTAPGTNGYFGVLKHHASFATTLEKGSLTFRDAKGQTKVFKMDGGFLEVLKNRVLVLTDKIE